MHVPWGISRALEEGRQVPSRGTVIWWHFWSEDNKCVSEYSTGTSPSLSIMISHPHFIFLMSRMSLLCLNSGKTRQSLLTVLISQRDKVLSAELVRAVLEKGRNSMLFTESSWPRRVYLHLSLQEKETAMQQPPLRAIWTTDSFRWMKNTFHASPQLPSGKMNIDSNFPPEHCTTVTKPNPLVFASQ